MTPDAVQPEENETYQKVVGLMHNHAPQPISDREAHEAARNLIGFARTALAIRRRMQETGDHGKRP